MQRRLEHRVAQAGPCSKFTHEGGAEVPPPLPEPAEFATDIKELAPYAKPVEERAKATEARRKLAGLGA